MNLNPATVNKFLKTLRESNSIAEKCTALTCITSHAGKGLAQALTKTHYNELCTLLIDMVTSCDPNAYNDITKSFNVILKEFVDNESIIFQLALQINRKTRLKFFDFLRTVDVAILSRCITDKDTMKFLDDCLQGINVNDMRWLAKGSTSDNIDVLKEAESKKLTDDQETEHQLISKVIDFLQKLYDYASTTPTCNISQFHILILDKVAALAYMGHTKQRNTALRLLQTAVNLDLVSYIKEKHVNAWAKFKSNLHEIYSPRMTLLVTHKELIWSSLWSLTIRMLGTEAHRNSALINELLCVEEKAFKSSETEIRKRAFLCWKNLIDNFALNPEEFQISKRVKLLCIPLNAKNSKIEIIALTKLEVWWHLIVTMFEKNTTQHITSVIVQFLNFCFGPLGDTPLLSKKQNLAASPGKIFFKTKIFAIDALIQMLAMENDDRCLMTSLKERLPTAIPRKIFEDSYKSFLHSVSEAVIMISNLSDSDLEHREKINIILWSNLLHYILQANLEKKSNMFKELLLVIDEMITHTDDSTIISDLILNFIVPELVKVSDLLIYRDCTLIDMLTKLLTPSILKNVKGKNINELRVLIDQAIKPEHVAVYHPSSLLFVRRVLEEMAAALAKNPELVQIIDLWCILADLMTRYMGDDQPINEGTDLSHNLSTIETLVNFPFKNNLCLTRAQVNTVAKNWKHLYKQFDMQADRIPSVKHNLILNTTAKVMLEALSKNEKNYILIAHCLTPLMETINYERLPTTGQVPALVHILRDVTMLSITHNDNDEAELALKSMDSFLITVFGLSNAQRTLLYLEVLRPAIELMLKEQVSERIEKEVQNTWEYVAIIIGGNPDALSAKFISSFRQIILLARRHKNPYISAKAGALLELKTKKIKEEVRTLLILMEREASLPKTPVLVTLADPKSTKSIKIVGSFLGKVTETSRTPKPLIIKREPKKIAPLPPDPDSQDYVVIKSDPKFDVNKLTEHQKECLKRRREDIPSSMLNDTSQSGTTDTQDLQQWFDNSRLKNEAKKDTADIPSSSKQEENATVCSTTKQVDTTNTMKNDKDKGSAKAISPVDPIIESLETSGNISDVIAKKLNFESRDEFPDDDDDDVDDTKNKQTSSDNLQICKDTKRRAEDTEEPYSHFHIRRKVGHSKTTGERSIPSMLGRYLKRKAGSDNESEPADRKRSRKLDPAYDTSDSESIHSVESQSETQLSLNKDRAESDKLSEQTKREISRLKIDMVAQCVLPTDNGRRRSKKLRSDDLDDHGKHKSLKDRDLSESEPSQELVKKRRRRSFKTETDVGREDTSPTDRKRLIDSKDQKMNSSTESEDKSIESTLNEEPTLPKIDRNNSDESITSMKTRDKSAEQVNDPEEIVESSQEPTILRSPQRRRGKLPEGISSSPSTSKTTPKSSEPSSPVKQKSIEQEGTIDEDKIPQKENIDQSKKILSEESSKLATVTIASTSSFISSSPQSSQRRLGKIKSPGFSPHGRGAHMLGLISAKPLPRDRCDEENKKEKEMTVQRTRPAILRHSATRSNAGSSRQEKIFNNMKAGEFSSLTQSAFSNLKNDGEKVSPKKDILSTKEVSTMDHDYTETKENETSKVPESNLPILEWSSANPPSLTASPSFSILKRHKSLPIDSELDITPKRKRVSFADPPVSQEVGYEVQSSMKIRGSASRLSGRKETPLKLKSLRPGMIVMMTGPTVADSEMETLNEVDLQEEKNNDWLAKIADDLDDNVNFDSDTDDNQEEVPTEKLSLEEMDTQVITNNSLMECENSLFTPSAAGTLTLQTPQDNNNIKTPRITSQLDVTNDSVIEKILNETTGTKSVELEDTVDINNISRLNSSANSDELFISKTPRTSSQIAAMAAVAEADTLPITDSMLLSQTMSQYSQGTQNSISLSTLDHLDAVTPICPTLIECQAPLSKIIKDLTNPLWISHMSNWFNSRGMKVVGDLAKMTERQIADIPTKGDPKVKYVKEVLDKFAECYISKLESEVVNDSEYKSLEAKISSSSSPSTSRDDEHMEIIEETIEVTSQPRDESELHDTLSTTSADITASPGSLNSSENAQDQIDAKSQNRRESNDYGSIILDSISPPAKTSTGIEHIKPKLSKTVSIGVLTELLQESKAIQVSLSSEECADQMSSEDVSDNVAERLAKIKSIMQKMPEEDYSKEIMQLLGSEKMWEVSCSALGLDEVLRKLSDVFNTDELLATVLSKYGMEITAEQMKKYLNLVEVDKVLSEKYSVQQLCDFLLPKLEKEEKQNITTPLQGVRTLSALLKRYPRDVIINQVISNHEIIPPSIILDIGINTNSAETVADTVLSKCPTVVEKISKNQAWNDNTIVKLCKSTKIPDEQWQNIFEAAADHMNNDDFLNAISKLMKKRMKE